MKSTQKKWTFRYLSLNLHLWLGFGSAVFLLTLGFTGAIIGFEQEIPRWLHRNLFYVHPVGQQLPEAQLIQAAEQRLAPAHIRSITLSRRPKVAQIMQVPDPSGDPRASTRIFVDPYTVSVLGSLTGPTGDERFLQTMHNTHLRLVQSFGDSGRLVVSIAGAILVVELVFGLILWWRIKRATIKLRGASWFHVFFDAHNAIGIYSALLLLIISVTGVIIGFDFFEPLIFKITKSEPLGATPVVEFDSDSRRSPHIRRPGNHDRANGDAGRDTEWRDASCHGEINLHRANAHDGDCACGS